LKTQEVARLHEKIAKEEDNERKKFAAVDERRRRDDEARRRGDEQRQRRAAAAASAMQQKINDLEAQLVEQLASLASATPPFRDRPASVSWAFGSFPWCMERMIASRISTSSR
jgi:hypothetical protein